MVKKSGSILVLRQLRDEAYVLMKTSTLGDDLQNWHMNVLKELSIIFGPNCSERKPFENFRFKIGAGTIHQRKQLAELEAIISGASEIYRIDNNNYFRQVLADAADELYALILRLESE